MTPTTYTYSDLVASSTVSQTVVQIVVMPPAPEPGFHQEHRHQPLTEVAVPFLVAGLCLYTGARRTFFKL
jgi:hypothetical protein